MKVYQTAERPDPRIRTQYVDAALDVFETVRETGQGQMIFLNGYDGSGESETLQEFGKHLTARVGNQYAKRIINLRFDNGTLSHDRDFNMSSAVQLINGLLPLTLMGDPSKLAENLVTMLTAIIDSSATIQEWMNAQTTINNVEPTRDSTANGIEAFEMLLRKASQEGSIPLVLLIDNFDEAKDSLLYHLTTHVKLLLRDTPMLWVVTVKDGPNVLPQFDLHANEDDQLSKVFSVAQSFCVPSKIGGQTTTPLGQWWTLEDMTLAEVGEWVGYAAPDVPRVLYEVTHGNPDQVNMWWAKWTKSKAPWWAKEYHSDYNQNWVVRPERRTYKWRFLGNVDKTVLQQIHRYVETHLEYLCKHTNSDVNPSQLEYRQQQLALGAQEGRTFTATALAQIFEGDHNETANEFYHFLDNVLVISEDNPNGLLVKEESIEIIDEPIENTQTTKQDNLHVESPKSKTT
ncbi:MAG: ATP-binding protein, partial [Chloroflexota bacterium]